jgi:hypothetical protein
MNIYHITSAFQYHLCIWLSYHTIYAFIRQIFHRRVMLYCISNCTSIYSRQHHFCIDTLQYYNLITYSYYKYMFWPSPIMSCAGSLLAACSPLTLASVYSGYIQCSLLHILGCNAMLGGSLVTTIWCVHRLRMEETLSRYGGKL